MSLKDWIKKVDSSQLNEFAQQGQIQIKPASQMPKTPGQQNQPQGQQPQGQMNKNTQVIQQGNKTLGTVDNPQLAQQIKQSIGKGEMTLMPDGQSLQEDDMEEGILDFIKKSAPPSGKDSEANKMADFRDRANVLAKQQARSGSGDVVGDFAKGGKELGIFKESQLNESVLEEILASHPHEHKQCQEGWGMHESLYSALRDHYFREGHIPRDVMYEGGQALRDFVEECYAKDTTGTNQDAINSGMLDEDDGDLDDTFNEGSMDPQHAFDLEPNLKMRGQYKGSQPSFLDKAAKKVGDFGMKALDKLHPSDEKLRSGPLGPLDEEASDLERMLRQSTKESTMFEGKKSKKSVEEAVEKTKTGIKHKADAGGYGRKDDEEDTDEDGKKVKKDEPKKGRGRPKKTDNVSGEDTKFDFSALSKTSGSKAPKDDKKGKVIKGKAQSHADNKKEEELDESMSGSDPYARYREKKVARRMGDGQPEEHARRFDVVDGPGKTMYQPKPTSHVSKKRTTPFGKVGESLKGGQKKLDINKNGKLDKADFAMLGNQKKKRVKEDAQMESWDMQLKGLLTESKQLNEGITVSTSIGQEGGQDSVSITANNEDAHQLLQLLQNAGMGSGVPGHAVQAASAPATVLPKDGQPTVGSIANTNGAPNASAQKDIGGDSAPIMAMPRGMLLSVNDETEMPTEPEEFGTLDQEEVVDALSSEQSSADDGSESALVAIKKLMGQHGSSEVAAPEATPAEPSQAFTAGEEVEESDDKQTSEKDTEDGDEDDTIPDDGYSDGGKSYTDEEMDLIKKDKKNKVEEGQQCNKCGGLMEAEHQCEGQLNEWSNSPQGQSDDEQFDTDMNFMQNIITAGLNGKKSTGQTTVPVIASQLSRTMSEGYNVDVATLMRKLSDIR